MASLRVLRTFIRFVFLFFLRPLLSHLHPLAMLRHLACTPGLHTSFTHNHFHRVLCFSAQSRSSSSTSPCTQTSPLQSPSYALQHHHHDTPTHYASTSRPYTTLRHLFPPSYILLLLHHHHTSSRYTATPQPCTSTPIDLSPCSTSSQKACQSRARTPSHWWSSHIIIGLCFHGLEHLTRITLLDLSEPQPAGSDQRHHRSCLRCVQ